VTVSGRLWGLRAGNAYPERIFETVPNDRQLRWRFAGANMAELSGWKQSAAMLFGVRKNRLARARGVHCSKRARLAGFAWPERAQQH
jgi:hypothetical protein